MCGQNREKRVEKCPIPWCRLPPLWLFSCSRIPYKNLSPYNFPMVYLKMQLLVLSMVGLHARTEAERQVSMSKLPVLETAEDKAAMHQALMAKPKCKKSAFSCNVTLFWLGSEISLHPHCNISLSSQEIFNRLIELLSPQLLWCHLLHPQMKVTNFHLCKELYFGMALQRQETQRQPLAPFNHKLLLVLVHSIYSMKWLCLQPFC